MDHFRFSNRFLFFRRQCHQSQFTIFSTGNKPYYHKQEGHLMGLHKELACFGYIIYYSFLPHRTVFYFLEDGPDSQLDEKDQE